MNPNAIPKVQAVKLVFIVWMSQTKSLLRRSQAITHTINADAVVHVNRTGRDNGGYQEQPVGVMTCDI